MAFHIVRESTVDDHMRLDAAAKRFHARHTVQIVRWWIREDDRLLAHEVATACILNDLNFPHETKLSPLWRRAARRALRHNRATEIAYGNVGYSTGRN